ncbi:hypothetical protein HF086_013110 [Spodoptera exigua]|uniref:Uncharacterized protein n=1 Tax=Spodoptera exigua TaxID=7107 RepID=A0A922M9Z1_SPOEX|nr:hypothetical protein HF086_013110 [Spodoptera exigua]
MFVNYRELICEQLKKPFNNYWIQTKSYDVQVQLVCVVWEASRGDGGRHLAGVSAAHRRLARLQPPRDHMSLMNMRRYDYENMPRPEYGIWRRGARVARANGRSLIYEPGAAPPPCHNRIPGARARCRPPPAAASRSVPLRMASGAPGHTPRPLRTEYFVRAE